MEEASDKDEEDEVREVTDSFNTNIQSRTSELITNLKDKYKSIF